MDFVKVDDISWPYVRNGPEIEAVRGAIDSSGRAMVLSLSPGETDIHAAVHAAGHANMWRISDDFWDHWNLLRDQFERLNQWSRWRGPGAWPDADMIPIGLLCLGGYPDGQKLPEHTTQLSDAEIKTLMTLWCIARSPLMWGGDPVGTTATYYRYLTNRELLAMNRDGANPRQLNGFGTTRIWMSDIPGSDDKYLAFFNLDDTTPAPVTFDFWWERLSGVYRVHNLWTGRDEEEVSESVSRVLAPHSCAALRLVKR